VIFNIHALSCLDIVLADEDTDLQRGF